jgi:hypothetical protein
LVVEDEFVQENEFFWMIVISNADKEANWWYFGGP